MRYNLTHAEMIMHRDLWAFAQQQRGRWTTELATQLTLIQYLRLTLQARRECWNELWPAPAFTRRLARGYPRPDWGICVAFRETQNCFGMEGLKKAIIHAEDEGEGIVGGWFYRGDGRFYFDSVRVYQTMALAVPAARLNAQIGIYDLTRNVYLDIDMASPVGQAITQAQLDSAKARKLPL